MLIRNTRFLKLYVFNNIKTTVNVTIKCYLTHFLYYLKFL